VSCDHRIASVCLRNSNGGGQWRIQKFLKRGAEDNLSAPSSFIANAHNEIYAFYTEKAAFLKNMSQ